MFSWLKLIWLTFITEKIKIIIDSMVFEKEAPKDVQSFSSEIVGRINTNTRRIKMIEQRIDGIELRVGALEEKIIDEMSDLKKSFEQISTDIKAVAEDLLRIQTEILKINKNLDKKAKKIEVKELESLIDLYNPIKSRFVTRNEVKKIIEERLSRKT